MREHYYAGSWEPSTPYEPGDIVAYAPVTRIRHRPTIRDHVRSLWSRFRFARPYDEVVLGTQRLYMRRGERGAATGLPSEDKEHWTVMHRLPEVPR